MGEIIYQRWDTKIEGLNRKLLQGLNRKLLQTPKLLFL